MIKWTVQQPPQRLAGIGNYLQDPVYWQLIMSES